MLHKYEEMLLFVKKCYFFVKKCYNCYNLLRIVTNSTFVLPKVAENMYVFFWALASPSSESLKRVFFFFIER